jgi:hypothetical protein
MFGRPDTVVRDRESGVTRAFGLLLDLDLNLNVSAPAHWVFRSADRVAGRLTRKPSTIATIAGR